MRYWTATGPDGTKIGWECVTRDVAERNAQQRFGQPVQVIEVSFVDWRKHWRRFKAV